MMMMMMMIFIFRTGPGPDNDRLDIDGQIFQFYYDILRLVHHRWLKGISAIFNETRIKASLSKFDHGSARIQLLHARHRPLCAQTLQAADDCNSSNEDATSSRR